MKSLGTALASIVLVFATAARANSFATDATDLWWNSGEGGWGVNVSHQDDTLFLTFFVYGPNNAPTWYSASDVRYVTSPPEAVQYTGKLYQTTGPYLGAANFDPRNVAYAEVGTVTFTVQAPNLAVLSYTVNGVTVNKALQRYTFRVNNMSGIYQGVLAGTKSACTVPANNGPLDTFFSNMTVSLAGTSLTIATTDTAAVTCSFDGGYDQTGRLGIVNGVFGCSDGRTGPFSATEIVADVSGFHGKFSYSWQACHWNGSISAARP
jgi:hypothetical protein